MGDNHSIGSFTDPFCNLLRDPPPVGRAQVLTELAVEDVSVNFSY